MPYFTGYSSIIGHYPNLPFLTRLVSVLVSVVFLPFAGFGPLEERANPIRRADEPAAFLDYCWHQA